MRKGEDWPEEWREGVVVPIITKGKGEKVEDYRGVTLTQTVYKIYAAVLAQKLREEIKSKGVSATESSGFQKRNGNNRYTC